MNPPSNPSAARDESRKTPSQGHQEGVPQRGSSSAGYPPRGSSSGRNGSDCASPSPTAFCTQCTLGGGAAARSTPGSAAPSPKATPPTDVVPGAPSWMGRRRRVLGSSSGARRPLRYARLLSWPSQRSLMGSTKPNASARRPPSATRQDPRGRVSRGSSIGLPALVQNIKR